MDRAEKLFSRRRASKFGASSIDRFWSLIQSVDFRKLSLASSLLKSPIARPRVGSLIVELVPVTANVSHPAAAPPDLVAGSRTGLLYPLKKAKLLSVEGSLAGGVHLT